MTVRTDCHRPAEIQPTDYEFVGIEYMKIEELGQVFLLAEYRKDIERHMARTGGTYSRHQHGGNCHICGAHAIYTALFWHAPSNSYIRTGHECAEKLDYQNEQAFRAIREGVKRAIEAKAGKQKAEAILADMGMELAAEWAFDASDEDLVAAGCADWREQGDERWAERTQEWGTLGHMIGSLVRYGHWSEKQETFAKALLGRIQNRRAIEAQRAAEKEAAEPCPTGREKVTATVIKTEWRENGYGGGLKMLVKEDRGFLLWGSVPSALALMDLPATDVDGQAWTEQRGLKRDDRVEFTATLEPSARDEKFGFYKRPTKVKLTETER